jgi:hypothetical protein
MTRSPYVGPDYQGRYEDFDSMPAWYRALVYEYGVMAQIVIMERPDDTPEQLREELEGLRQQSQAYWLEVMSDRR